MGLTIIKKSDNEMLNGYKGKRKQLKDLVLATRNGRTMLQPRKMVEVAEEIIKFNIDVVDLQEIRWSGKGKSDKKGYTILYCGGSGLGFSLQRDYAIIC